MNEQTAIQKGLQFAGCFEYLKEEIQPEIDRLRKDGYKAYLVTVPPNPLSRGHHGTGYSVYTEPRYFKDQRAKSIHTFISQYSQMVADTHKKYEDALNTELNALKTRYDVEVLWLKENGYPTSL